MISNRINQLLVDQIERELFSSHLYLSMACWADSKGYPGVAQWMHLQSLEERDHMLKLVEYIGSRGGKVVIPQVGKPQEDFQSVEDLFTKTYIHEQSISESLSNIVGETIEEKDFMTNSFMQWFVTEQIEEERSVQTILDRLRLAGEDQLYLFDKDILSMRNSEPSQTP